MDPVFDAQYLRMKEPFNNAGYEIAVAYTRDRQVDFIYQVGVLLARQANVPELQEALPRLRRPFARPEPVYGDLVLLPIGGEGHDDDDGFLTVPAALDLIERRVGRERMFADGGALATAAHVVHTAKLCSATEPEVPGGPAPAPYPPPAAPGAGQDAILLGISDTGLWEQPSWTVHPWMAAEVDGVADPPGPVLAGGQLSIPYEGGHGTMVAGVARCTAPGAGVYVGNHFPFSGGTLEYMLARDLETLIADKSPDLINLSAGGYTRGDVPPLSFIEFRQRNPGVMLVAAAGNDSTDRPFWPAAFDWASAVGALGADLQNLAWFSNYGDWVDVYALGEGLVNAYATGVYTYQEPPKQGATQVFDGMARWSGTSFAAPLVAGLIVAEMARSQSSPTDAWQTVLGTAVNIGGYGPVLL